jgi:hypothetical protein
MKKLLVKSILLSLTIVLLNSCVTQKTAFTYQMYNDSDWTEYDLRQMKFYLSDEIVIGREIKNRKTTIKHGKIKKVNGQLMEEIAFSKGSVGRFVKQPRSNQLIVRFNDCDDCSLVFERKSKKDGRYLLHTRGRLQRKGQVRFGGSTYFASANSQSTHLMIKVKEINKRK